MEEDNQYILHNYKNNQIRQRTVDGYFSATDMCKSVNKHFKDFYKINYTKECIRILSTHLSLIETQLIIVNKGNSSKFTQGTWVHPQVATILGLWISPDFAVKVSTWTEEWKQYDSKNTEIYNQNLCELLVSNNDQTERSIQEQLCKELNAQKEVRTDVGFIDVLSHDKIIEIKEFSQWKSALGQILTYSEYYPDREKVIVLFGDTDIELLDTIKNIYHKFEIRLQLFS